MNFSRPEADVFVPHGSDVVTPEAALARTTHLCLAAHQDDIEIMAYHGIAACYGRSDKWFSGVVVTDGAGSSRTGPYAHYTDSEMQTVRRSEQRKAAFVGDYSVQIQLAHPSRAVKDPANRDVGGDLSTVLALAHAEIVYLHQPADKHETHIAVFAHCLAALRAMPLSQRPRRVYGCEVWRDLDWMIDDDKQALDVGDRPNLAGALVGVFDSQIAGGKRYDLATAGRRLAHATYHTAHAADKFEGITWAIDLTPLIDQPTLSVVEFTSALINRFKTDVTTRLGRFGFR